MNELIYLLATAPRGTTLSKTYKTALEIVETDLNSNSKFKLVNTNDLMQVRVSFNKCQFVIKFMTARPLEG